MPHTLGSISVHHDGHEFFVIDSKGIKSAIQRADLPKELRGISSEMLHKMMDVGYLSVRKRGDDYALSFNGRVRGGGPILAGLVYVGMNVAGGVMVVVGAVTAPVGGAVLITAGVATVTAAPYTLLVTLPAGPV